MNKPELYNAMKKIKIFLCTSNKNRVTQEKIGILLKVNEGIGEGQKFFGENK